MNKHSRTTPSLVITPHDRAVLTQYLRSQIPVLVEGAPGTGKSLAVRVLGREIYGELQREHGVERDADWREPLKIDITEDTEVRDLIGDYDLVRYYAHVQANPGTDHSLCKYFNAGPVTRALREGRLLIVEELDRAGRETLFPVFFDLIEYRRAYVPALGKTVEARDFFNVAITVNRTTDIGTVALPKALLRRPRRLELYDPSRERGVNRWRGVQFEARIVLANVQASLDRQGLGKEAARQLIVAILEQVIFPLREQDALSDPPTPAEMARWFEDALDCEGPRLLGDGASPHDQLEVLLRYRGAVVKSKEDDDVLIQKLLAHFGGDV